MNWSISAMDTLPTTSSSKRGGGGGRSKIVQTSKPSLLLAFFSCVAWLYVAGRFRIPIRFSFISIRFILISAICFQFFFIWNTNGFDYNEKCARLWQDAENRNLLASLLKKNSSQVFFFFLFFSVLIFKFILFDISLVADFYDLWLNFEIHIVFAFSDMKHGHNNMSTQAII